METAETMAARAARLVEIDRLVEVQYGDERRRLQTEDWRLRLRVWEIVDRCSQISNTPRQGCVWHTRKLYIKEGLVHLVYDQHCNPDYRDGIYHLKFPAEWLDYSFPLDDCAEAVREAKARGKAAYEQRKAAEDAKFQEDLRDHELRMLAELLAKYPQGS